MTEEKGTPSNNRVPPSLTPFAPENTSRIVRRVGTLERYPKAATPSHGHVGWQSRAVAREDPDRIVRLNS